MTFDICSIIYNFLDFGCKHKFRLINRSHLKLKIKDFINIKHEHTMKINDTILKNYSDVTDLKLSTKVTSINHLTNLTRLILTERSNMESSCFNKCTKITNLKLDRCYCIEDINFLTNLTELCVVNEKGVL